MKWGFPESVSTYGGDIDAMYAIILYVTGAMFLVVEATLIYFIIRYRRREGGKADYVHGHLRTEIIWTLVPFVLVAMLAVTSAGTWLDLKHPSRFPAAGLDLKVRAKQFEWNVTYPGADGRLGTGDDFVKRNQLHLPTGVPVRLTLSAEDVIHSFFLPEFRVKQDAVPGMETSVWFEATKPGTYVLGCAELCGLGHYKMRGTVTVHTPQEFQRWQQEQGAS
ncbi:MAG: cytochrome c oxidase subunit II [Gemmatimonadetes bacterium]|nr:cytochrome c oxidase subunit II [Gemmatimonadota bacterium]